MIPEITNQQSALTAICQKLGVNRLDVFGSAVTGRFRPGESDLDFIVEFSQEALGPGYADRYFELKEALSELFSMPVDLLVASAVKNPYFRESIEQTKTLLYAA